MTQIAQRILMVQSDATIGLMLKRFLSQQGYQVDEAQQSTDATAMPLDPQHPFDVILLDLGGKLDQGFKWLKMCRDLYPETPVIVLSAIMQEETIAWGRRMGAKAWIPRPRALKELLDRVQSSVQQYAPLAS